MLFQQDLADWMGDVIIGILSRSRSRHFFWSRISQKERTKLL